MITTNVLTVAQVAALGSVVNAVWEQQRVAWVNDDGPDGITWGTASRAPRPFPGMSCTSGGQWPICRMRSALRCSPRRDAWRTVVDLVCVGDCLTLVWLAGNNNQHLRDAELFSDELCLLVMMRGEPRLVYRVAHAVTPDNTARMIRRLR